jgi:hypothetical protein
MSPKTTSKDQLAYSVNETNRPGKAFGFDTLKEVLNKYLCKNNFALIN